jgi:hypothetical protein
MAITSLAEGTRRTAHPAMPAVQSSRVSTPDHLQARNLDASISTAPVTAHVAVRALRLLVPGGRTA